MGLQRTDGRPHCEDRQVQLNNLTKEDYMLNGRLPWRIEGDTPVHPVSCSDTPRFGYNLVADPAEIVDAVVKHIIWHKMPLPSQQYPMPGAIERVLVDTDVDYAIKKTPQHS